MPQPPAEPHADALTAALRRGIVAWDRDSVKGTGEGEYTFLLSERERDTLAERLAGVVEKALGVHRPDWLPEGVKIVTYAELVEGFDRTVRERDEALDDVRMWKGGCERWKRDCEIAERERDEAVALLRELEESGNSEKVQAFLARLEGRT